MAAVTSAVVGAAVAVGSAVDARNARKDAAKGVEDANIESADQLARAGNLGRDDINEMTRLANYSAAAAGMQGIEPIKQDYENGRYIYDQYADRVLNDRGMSEGLQQAALKGQSVDASPADREAALREISKALEGKSPEEQAQIKEYLGALSQQHISQSNPKTNILSALGENITSEAMGGVNSKIYGGSSFLDKEINRQGGIVASGFEPTFREMLLSQTKNGVSAIDDVASIRDRTHTNLGSLALSRGANSASSLVGQGPALQQLSQGASEARALGGIASSNFNSNMVSALASQAGNYWGGK